jgi:hypothetical protein
MKYLLIIIAAMTFIGSAKATSDTDCCPGHCCKVSKSCCAF